MYKCKIKGDFGREKRVVCIGRNCAAVMKCPERADLVGSAVITRPITGGPPGTAGMKTAETVLV